jgi:hypothetical protein
VQLRPPGVGVLDRLGKGLTPMEPGSFDDMQMVVEDADAIRAELADRAASR